jgi:Domain of Unknown Function (DUF1259)
MLHLILATLLAAATPLDTHAIDSAFGLTGAMQPGGVYRVSIPRKDLQVFVDGVLVKTALALGGYAVYEPAPSGALVMGDLPLLPAEIDTVQKQLSSEGFEITALHNHLLREQPHVMYMHFMKIGDAAEISRQLRAAIMTTGFRNAHAVGPTLTLQAEFPNADAATVDSGLALKGKAHDGIYSVSVARPETITVHGVTLPPAMGVATSLNFEATRNGNIAATGDFVLSADQVDPVRAALVSHGIEVTALHQHLVGADPTLYFMHFWAAGAPSAVLPGLRAAIDIVRPAATH